eukprot:CAMPEP_0117527268 /NCGR_PEP_ID=MMETSP0784-20121206/36708_1 /TAXON_ID=39447 /ORGANISM="" /LENGTH=121 /DNA_ID=CAMNT_0005323511 /DNA_START=142 /DNA_END=507 /DNA_ORIENTATION=-
MALSSVANDVHSAFRVGSFSQALPVVVASIIALASGLVFLGALGHADVATRAAAKCPDSTQYDRCQAWQDVRSLFSFLFGAMLCWCVKRQATDDEDDEEEEDPMPTRCFNATELSFLAGLL